MEITFKIIFPWTIYSDHLDMLKHGSSLRPSFSVIVIIVKKIEVCTSCVTKSVTTKVLRENLSSSDYPNDSITASVAHEPDSSSCRFNNFPIAGNLNTGNITGFRNASSFQMITTTRKKKLKHHSTAYYDVQRKTAKINTQVGS